MSIKINVEKCTGCETCIDVCPSEAIKIEGDVAVVDNEECTDCGSCVEECPEEAIEFDED